jgi:hypothetical protein
MGKASRDKGLRFERSLVHACQDQGIGAERIPLSGAAGGSFCGDVSIPVQGTDRKVECKTKAGGRGFKQIYGWLGSNYALAVKQDRDETLIVLRLTDFLTLAKLPPDTLGEV